MAAVVPWVIALAGTVVAGGATWFLTRDEMPSDGDLVRHFVVSMAMTWLLAGGMPSGEWAHRLLDPRIALRDQLAAIPVR